MTIDLIDIKKLKDPYDCFGYWYEKNNTICIKCRDREKCCKLTNDNKAEKQKIIKKYLYDNISQS